MSDLHSIPPDAIAIIGMRGRFPGAPNVDAFWRNLRNGVESISLFSEAELRRSGVASELIRNPNYVPAAGVLSEFGGFDTAFFHFTAREAECTDPQHRLLLECAWEALEQAGYVGAGFDGRVGVYAGAGPSGYWMHNLAPNPDIRSSIGAIQLLIGNAKDYVATRISYKLNLTGPSLTISTACSTSLVAVHLACTSLLDFHCDIALAGGVSVQVPAREGYLYQEGGIGSPDGHCRPFDAKAAGTVTGSGAGIVTLRRLEDALKARDTIHAVILGSAVNNDGSDKVGFTAPSEFGQAIVIAEALNVANVSPDTITYIEAHGTGTALGDPVEVAALTRVFRRSTARRQFCALGSVKSNFGHLDEAAGVTGLIKTVLALENRTLPPSLHFENPNPKLDLENSPFFVSATAREWVSDGPRRAGVSSFGIGGTNAHVVLEEAPRQVTPPNSRPATLLVLSARTQGALHSLCQDLAEHLARRQDLNIEDVGFTLAVGREVFAERYAAVCDSRADAVAKLRSVRPARTAVAPRSARRHPVFIFPGDGSPYAHIGLELYRTEPVFRRAIDDCASILKRRSALDPLDALFPSNDPSEELAGSSNQAARARARLFSLEYATSVLLQSWGIEPKGMIGHNLGERVAATLAGVIPLEDALVLVAACDGVDELVRKTTLHAPRIPFVSSVTGDWITPEQAINPDYWSKFLHEPARSAGGLKPIAEIPDAVWIEVGPESAQIPFLQRQPDQTNDVRILPTLGSPRSNASRLSTMLSTLGQLWISGVAVDWNGFFKFEERRRIPLPTYPFERQRYWIDTLERADPLKPRSVPDKPRISDSPIDSWFYTSRWVQICEPAGNRFSHGAWVLFADELGLADAVATLLRGLNAEVAVVRHGDTYRRLAANKFVLPLDDATAHARLWQELDRQIWSVANLLHFALLNPGRPASVETRFDPARTGLLALLALAQGLGSSTAARKLGVITNNTQAVTGDEIACAENATLWGATRVVAKEYPNLQCYSVDLDWSDLEDSRLAKVAASLLAALAQSATSLAVRAGSLWEQRVEPARLAEANSGRIRERGTYLITGGLGSMGLAFAEYLAQTARARLVLISRKGLTNSQHESARMPERARQTDSAGRFPLLAQTNAVEDLVRHAQNRTEVFPLSNNPGLEPLLNRYCSSLVWQFVSGGFPSLEPGSRTSHHELHTRLGVLAKFQTFFELFLRLLSEDGIIEQHGDDIEVLNQNVLSPDHLGSELAQRFPQFVPLGDLILHCARNYAQALSGEIPAINVLYPDGTSRWLDTALGRVPSYTWDGTYLRAAADLVSCLAATRPDRVCILEVGGGGGGLTSLFADMIASGRIEYHFTDISPTFVSRAKEAAEQRGLHNVRFSRFDITRPPEPQGLRTGGYDLVLGYNVVHATPDLVRTTSNLRSLILEGGGLILVETINAPRWIHLIWGLTDGWWSFTDRLRRRWSPLVSVDEWEKVLLEAGFTNVSGYPRDPGARRHRDAALITALSPGRPANFPCDSLPVLQRSPEEDSYIRRRINQMETAGAEVCVIAADVSDPAEVAQAVETAEAQFGPIQGVIHTAGVLGQTLIRDHDAAEVRRVLAPKVDGTLNLASALRNRWLDFFILCSSMSSIEPIAGQFGYSAANAFLDSFALSRAAKFADLTVAVNWGFWQELGMIGTARIPEAAKQSVLNEIRSAGWSRRGVEIFARILQSDVPGHLLVSPREPLSNSDVPPAGEVMTHPTLHGCVLESATRAVFSGMITAGDTWVVDEHRVAGQSVLPGTAYLDLAVAAFWHRHGRGPVELTDVCFLAPMVFAEGQTRLVRLILEEGTSLCEFRVLSQFVPDKWQEHARGEIRRIPRGTSPGRIDLETIEMSLGGALSATTRDPGRFWDRVTSFTDHWRNISGAVFGENNGLARLELPAGLAVDLPNYALHPALLDTATGFLAFRPEYDAFVPFSFRRVCVFDSLPARCASVFGFLPAVARDTLVIAGSVVDLLGNEIVRVDHYALRRTAPLAATAGLSSSGVPDAPENAQLEMGVSRTVANISVSPRSASPSKSRRGRDRGPSGGTKLHRGTLRTRNATRLFGWTGCTRPGMRRRSGRRRGFCRCVQTG
jgi:acyl transferase domain-containing protein/SAM-dependent methyltransferase